jgi:hypothetical protein
MSATLHTKKEGTTIYILYSLHQDYMLGTENHKNKSMIYIRMMMMMMMMMKITRTPVLS